MASSTYAGSFINIILFFMIIGIIFVSVGGAKLGLDSDSGKGLYGTGAALLIITFIINIMLLSSKKNFDPIKSILFLIYLIGIICLLSGSGIGITNQDGYRMFWTGLAFSLFSLILIKTKIII